ncbi:MAG: DNA cytosine methyltransferase [Deltaproteobacteria bacterium]|nr:DNA cytosine methyltransferase [Deltaproteobacteria bacterium]
MRNINSEISQSDEIRFIDLFAGAGGLSCGLEQAGFKPILANEINETYASTYKTNNPDCDVIIGDVKNISRKKIADIMKKYGEIDLIAGGPPCQGFSINAPIRNLDDQRNHLFKEFIRITKEIMPKAVLIENVPGIISLGKGTVVEQIYKELEFLGYKLSHRILFAGHYGVPQMRFRTVFIGLRDFHKPILFPEPEYNSTAQANFTDAKKLCLSILPILAQKLKEQINVWDAISDLPPINSEKKIGEYPYLSSPKTTFQKYMRRGAKKITSHFCNSLAKINIERLKHIPLGGSWRDIPFDLLPKGLTRAKRSDHTKRYGRLHPNSLCSTILTKCDPHWGSFFHPYQDRVITVREAARIQSFPDRYIFKGNMTKQYQQVGNAVPPLMAYSIGLAIREMITNA